MITSYHGVSVFRREGMKEEPTVAGRANEGGAMILSGNTEKPQGEVPPFGKEAGEAGPDHAKNHHQ